MKKYLIPAVLSLLLLGVADIALAEPHAGSPGYNNSHARPINSSCNKRPCKDKWKKLRHRTFMMMGGDGKMVIVVLTPDQNGMNGGLGNGFNGAMPLQAGFFGRVFRP